MDAPILDHQSKKIKKWDSRRHEKMLKRLWALGHDDARLAKETGFTEQTIRNQRRKYGLRANPSPARMKAGPIVTPLPVPRGKLNPITEAMSALTTRLREKQVNGFPIYFLDGVPCNLTEIMRETNRIRVARRQEQILVNPQWQVAEVVKLG